MNDLLPRTLESLKGAGFDHPIVFVDGMAPPLEGYETVIRPKNLRTYGNWMLTAWELLLREPTAGRYAIFQDDMVTYKNLRQYLETCTYPTQGYWNCYTFPQNDRPLNGWSPSNQRGLGAVALIFDSVTLRALLGCKYVVDRVMDTKRGHKSVDGAIVSALKKQGYNEYIHNPTLVQHTGILSSMGNKQHPLATKFQGEDFDALDLL